MYITLSIQGDYKRLLEKAKRNETIEVEGTTEFTVDNNKARIVVQGNTEKIPLSAWLTSYFFTPMYSRSLERKNFCLLEIFLSYGMSAQNNSNETHTFMCLGKAGRFGQH
jgi:hypothetical protein